MALQGTLRSEHPNNSLYTYEGTMSIRPSPLSGFDASASSGERQVPLGPDQILLRGAQLRNTPWLYGLVVFTGHDTKLMRNATAAPIKRTKVERQVNVHIVFLFIILIILCLISSIGSMIRSVSPLRFSLVAFPADFMERFFIPISTTTSYLQISALTEVSDLNILQRQMSDGYSSESVCTRYA
jgi:magnesium-transporting ATPase (P-type)